MRRLIDAPIVSGSNSENCGKYRRLLRYKPRLIRNRTGAALLVCSKIYY